MPATNTAVNAWRTRPPTTQIGIEAKAAPKCEKMPRQMSQKAHEKPTEREAQRVTGMRPQFCEKVVLGGEPKRAARNELTPSASRPPCTREETSSASVTAENSPVDGIEGDSKRGRQGERRGWARGRGLEAITIGEGGAGNVQVMVMSPMDSAVEMMKPMMIGIKYTASNEMGNVPSTQRKVSGLSFAAFV